MSEYLWAIYALIATLSGAAMFLTSEYFKQGGIGFLTIIRILTALYMVPFILVHPWPEDPRFYIGIGIAILCVPYMDILFFRLSVKHGAGLLSRLNPLVTITVFFTWLILDPELVRDYINTPFKTLGILGCLTLIAVSAAFLRQCSVTKEGFRDILPALLLSVVCAVSIKYGFDHADHYSATYVNLFLLSVLIIPLYFGIRMVDKQVAKEFVLTKKTYIAAAVASVFSALLIVFYNMSVDLVENPSYVNAISLTSSFWILLLYKAVGREETARVLPGLGIVIAAIALILITGQS